MKDKKRFNVILSSEDVARLDRLQQRTQATSHAEVIRRAITIYKAMQGFSRSGWEIVLRKRKKEKTIIGLE